MGVMYYVEIVMKILGGMGAFLLGMNSLSGNMTRLAHGKLRSMLNKTSKSRFAGLGIGTAVTMIAQSSALTTVMVVGLVNAGIMTLFQGTAIIMGANIGTTITAWIVSLISALREQGTRRQSACLCRCFPRMKRSSPWAARSRGSALFLWG